MKLNGVRLTPNEVAKILCHRFGSSASHIDWKQPIIANGVDESDGYLTVEGSGTQFEDLYQALVRHSNRSFRFLNLTKYQGIWKKDD